MPIVQPSDARKNRESATDELGVLLMPDRIELTALSTRALLALARQYRNDGPSHTRRAACDAYRAAVTYLARGGFDQVARGFAVCGNHIVWNATGVHEIRVRHIGQGTLGRVARQFSAELRRYLDASPEEERGIVAARRMVLGSTKDEVLAALGKYIKAHSIPLPKTTLSAAYDVAVDHSDWYGSPNTVWGSVAGLTQLSQAGEYADDRNAMDRAAGKLLAMAAPVSESRAIVLG
jgi:hypothetical protein